jgi:hypothetical protein
VIRQSRALLTFIGAVMAAGTAQAGRSNTPEFFYQPNVNQIELAGEYHQILSATSSTTANGVKVNDIKYGDSGYGLKLGYAFSESWAVRFSAGMDSFTTDVTDLSQNTTSTKSSGMNDLTFMLTNITPIGGWNLNVGIGVGLSPSKHMDAVAGGSDGNNQTGGTSIINYLGLSTPLGSGNYIGGKVQYTTRLQRTGTTNANPGVDYGVNGGNDTSLEAFYEMDFTPVDFDIAAGYFLTDGAVKTFPAGNTSTVDATKHMQVAIGAQYDITAGTNFRVEYLMAMYPDVAATGATAYNLSAISARLRFEF